jgi:membrane protease YdiL (CAAX protease family)
LRALSRRAEFVIVLIGAFGYDLAVNLLMLAYLIFAPASLGPWVPISDGDLRRLLWHELALMMILLPFLRLRGWSFERIGLRPSARETLIGIGIVIALIVLGMFIQPLTTALFPIFSRSYEGAPFAANLRLPTVSAISIVNPIYEELFVAGFVMTTLKKHFGAQTAINTSIALRTTYHLYQGASGVVGILPLSLVFAYWYERTGRLWPLVVAHVIFDFFALLTYVGS